jgi:hypothetical protein
LGNVLPHCVYDPPCRLAREHAQAGKMVTPSGAGRGEQASPCRRFLQEQAS